MPLDTTDLRVNYTMGELLEDQAPAEPMPLFESWFKAAQDSGTPEPNAMVVATMQPDGMPSARVVLLKEVTAAGFIFYSNYESRKGRELSQNPKAALVFNWLELQRQVRIEGRVERISAEKSAAYFHSRPLGSQLGAMASPQSQVIPNRRPLEDKMAELEGKYAGQDRAPKPDNWGGYLVVPQLIEFWQGRKSRLHDRLVYTKSEAGSWNRVRLAP
ncbi:MAG: pyridoxamine 5'-phosphate oxidase [Bacteroidota bacterium]